jgi:hypothetical protein
MGMATIDTLALRCAAASTMHYRAEKAHSEVGLAVMFVRAVVNLTIFCMGLMLILTSYLPKGAPGEAASGHARKGANFRTDLASATLLRTHGEARSAVPPLTEQRF